MEIGNYSISELQALQEKVQKELAGRREKEQDEAVRKIQAIADQAGLDLQTVLNRLSRRPRVASASAAKYRHPENPSVTWTGRGRRPRWVEEYVAKGKDLSDLRAEG